MKVRLLRFADTPFGVFGVLDLFSPAGDLVARLMTAEDDWKDNEPAESCIPAGVYTCLPSVFHKLNDLPTFEITKVPGGRSRILFHPGNTEEDSKGCILIGQDFGALVVADEDAPGTPKRAKWAITNSKAGFAEFMRLLAGVKSFELTIAWAKPGEWRP